MVARVAAELQYAEYEEQERMEKMGRRAEYGMPSRRATSAKRAMKRTSASRRAGHLFSVKAGGKHQRRLRKFH
ncbi:MAG: hypothetical protein KDA57_21035 [Planctomycetales bacterium]|nr:hypothetical protein [Planctomycetales bacterium]